MKPHLQSDHCWHRVAERGGRKIYVCCKTGPLFDLHAQKRQLCGGVYIPREGVTLEELSHGFLVPSRAELEEIARLAVKAVSEG